VAAGRPGRLQALLAALRPDNLLVRWWPRACPDRTEPIYGTRYSYTEDSGPAYAALLDPPRVAGLHAAAAQPLRAGAHHAAAAAAGAADRRAGAVAVPRAGHRVPAPAGRATCCATGCRAAWPPRSRAAALYEACVREALNETTYVAAEAGLRFMLNASLDGVTLAVEGWDESAGRLLDAVVPSLVEPHAQCPTALPP
jgi:insulysin